MSVSRPGRLRAETVAVGAGRTAVRLGEPLNVPVVMASNFRAGQDGATGVPSAGYARDDGTATWAALETAVGELAGKAKAQVLPDRGNCPGQVTPMLGDVRRSGQSLRPTAAPAAIGTADAWGDRNAALRPTVRIREVTSVLVVWMH